MTVRHVILKGFYFCMQEVWKSYYRLHSYWCITTILLNFSFHAGPNWKNNWSRVQAVFHNFFGRKLKFGWQRKKSRRIKSDAQEGYYNGSRLSIVCLCWINHFWRVLLPMPWRLVCHQYLTFFQLTLSVKNRFFFLEFWVYNQPQLKKLIN